MKRITKTAATLPRIQAAVETAPVGAIVTITDHPKRTTRQNSLYWEWIDRIRLHVGDSTGQWYSKEQMHDWLKAKFQPTDEVNIGGESRFIAKSTTKNDTKEMADYMDKVNRYCADSLGLFLPSPEVPQ